jgi:hypothetical protein
LAGFSLAHNIAWRDTRSTAAAAPNQRFDGQLSISGSIGPVRLTAGFQYEFQSQFTARRLRGEISYRLADWFVAFSADRDLANGGGQWVLAASRNWNGIRLGADLRHDEVRGDWQGLLTLAFTLDRAPLGQGLRFGREARSQRGTLLIDGFVDDNANGTHDSGEAPVDGFNVRIDPRGRVRADGRLLAEELPTDRAVAVEPLLEGIDNPYLVPLVPGALVTTRPAAPVLVSFAFVEGGEIEATLIGSEAAGALVQLTRCDDAKPVLRERAAFDGKVFITGLVPGCYVLSVKDTQVELAVEAGEVVRTELQLPSDRTAAPPPSGSKHF